MRLTYHEKIILMEVLEIFLKLNSQQQLLVRDQDEVTVDKILEKLEKEIM